MPKRNLLVMLLVVLAFGVIAAGCGSDDSSTTVSADDTDVSTTVEDSSTTVEDTSTSSDSDNPVDADAFYDACVDAVSGTAAESAGTTGCQQAKDALETCGKQAEASGNDEIAQTAIDACQKTADQAVEQLQSLGG